VGADRTLLERVLALDLERLTDAERAWLHDLKNKAFVLRATEQLKKLKEETLGNNTKMAD
jgi:hypothetical protein